MSDEERSTEAELRARNAELGAIFRALPDLLFELADDGKIVSYRAGRSEDLYVPPEEFLGKTMCEVLPRETAELLQAGHARVLAGERIVAVEYELPVAANVKCFEARFVAGQHGATIVVVRDVTELANARSELSVSEARYRQLVETSRDLIWSVDAECRWTFLNRSASARIFGCAPEALIGTPLREMQVSDAWSADVFVSEQSEPHETTMRRQDGTLVTLEFSGIAFYDAAGQITGATGTASDVTERRREQDERRQLDLKVQEAQRLESLGVLAGGIAHDFNNLLAAIVGAADVVGRRLPSASPMTEPVEIIRQAGWRASELSRQLLAYAGKGRFEMRHVSVGALVLDTAQLLDTAISKRVHVELDLPEGVPAVYGDVAQLRQVLVNLVTNASEATEGEGRVTVRTRTEAPWVELEVRDNGRGMEGATRQRMFDPFFTTKGLGRGLGLASVLGIVRAHGGEIDVESELGKGTRIRVRLPGSDQPAEPIVRAHPPSQPPIDGGIVLVVDDEPGVRVVTARLLEDAGLEVLTAPDGRAAIAIFERQRNIEAVVLDMTMPGLAGDETLAELRRIDPGVPLILTSGYERGPSWADPQGLTTFLQKPYRTPALVSAVRSALSTRSSSSGVRPKSA